MRVPSHFHLSIGSVFHLHFGVWEWEDHVESGSNTALVSGGWEYGAEIDYGAHGHLQLTRRKWSSTKEVHWALTGTISSLRIDKGFGFITSEQGIERFFHRSSVVWAVFELLGEGQRVQFKPEESVKGPRARMVRLIVG